MTVSLLFNMGWSKATILTCRYESVCSSVDLNKPAILVKESAHATGIRGSHVQTLTRGRTGFLFAQMSFCRPLGWPAAVKLLKVHSVSDTNVSYVRIWKKLYANKSEKLYCFTGFEKSACKIWLRKPSPDV